VTHPLIERLRSSKPDERISACRDAVEDPSAIVLIDALGEALGDPVKAVARAASDALAHLAGEIDGVEPVVRLALRSDDASRRWHAALTSARIEPPALRLLPPIVEALASCEGDVRWMAARLLVETGRLNPEVLPLVVGLVTGGESADVRRMATHCARELGPERPESTRALLEGTRDSDRSVRHAALTALAGLTDPSREVFDRLMEVIADPSDAPSRKIAAYSLGALVREHADEFSKASIAALGQIAKTDPDLDLRSVVERTLEQLKKSSEAVG
jgi:HEAT repeat protein